MSLIKSISGIRGTIGGKTGDNLSPIDVVKFSAAYGTWLKNELPGKKLSIVLGRDARISGSMVEKLVSSTICSLGIDVINIGLATTPTVEIAVTNEYADGGIILTASHNPKQWNALKLLNNKGEFLSANDGEKILKYAENEKDLVFSEVDDLGQEKTIGNYEDIHINKILQLNLVNKKLIESANFKIAIDCVNSVGGIAIPKLLKALGIKTIHELYCEPNGHFPHNPEPLPEHLKDISALVKEQNADMGFVVDPDVDRLAIIDEKGNMFGEEYTIVAVADYVLSKNKGGNTVSNLSSSRALKDITESYGGIYKASAVGEVNVVNQMKSLDSVIGGEGNGGVILPELHYGRDALVGIALFLSHLAEQKIKCSELKEKYPKYIISKNKIELTPDIDINHILEQIKENFKNESINDTDGVRIDFEKNKEWVHLRKSNTEPIIRIYAESENETRASELANKIISAIKEIAKK